MLKSNFLSITHLACAIASVSFLINSSTVFGAVTVHSMHRTIGGYAAASTNGVTQTNVFGGSFTNRGWLRLDRAATVALVGDPESARALASAKQDSTIAYSPSNFHFNATGSYTVSAESSGPGSGALFSTALATNRAVMSFTTDEECVVRVRSTVVESTPSPTTISLWLGATAILRADSLGIQQNGSPVATNGQIHRFTLAPGQYVLELNCNGQALTSGSGQSVFDASYQFEFTAVYSRLIAAMTTRPRFGVRRVWQEWFDGDYTQNRYARQFTWPLAAIRFDLVEDVTIVSPRFFPPFQWPTNYFFASADMFGSDGTNFTLTFPEVAANTNQIRFFKLYGIR